MRPVYDTGWGDCFGMCVASVLELPIDAVPRMELPIHEFLKQNPAPEGFTMEKYQRDRTVLMETEWYRNFCAWLVATKPERTAKIDAAWEEWFSERDLMCLNFAPGIFPKGYAIGGYRYGPHSHARVLLAGQAIHDPDPNFSIEEPEFDWKLVSLHVITPRDPSVLLKK